MPLHVGVRNMHGSAVPLGAGAEITALTSANEVDVVSMCALHDDEVLQLRWTIQPKYHDNVLEGLEMTCWDRERGKRLLPVALCSIDVDNGRLDIDELFHSVRADEVIDTGDTSQFATCRVPGQHAYGMIVLYTMIAAGSLFETCPIDDAGKTFAECPLYGSVELFDASAYTETFAPSASSPYVGRAGERLQVRTMWLETLKTSAVPAEATFASVYTKAGFFASDDSLAAAYVQALREFPFDKFMTRTSQRRQTEIWAALVDTDLYPQRDMAIAAMQNTKTLFEFAHANRRKHGFRVTPRNVLAWSLIYDAVDRWQKWRHRNHRVLETLFVYAFKMQARFDEVLPREPWAVRFYAYEPPSALAPIVRQPELPDIKPYQLLVPGTAFRVQHILDISTVEADYTVHACAEIPVEDCCEDAWVTLQAAQWAVHFRRPCEHRPDAIVGVVSARRPQTLDALRVTPGVVATVDDEHTVSCLWRAEFAPRAAVSLLRRLGCTAVHMELFDSDIRNACGLPADFTASVCADAVTVAHYPRANIEPMHAVTAAFRHAMQADYDHLKGTAYQHAVVTHKNASDYQRAMLPDTDGAWQRFRLTYGVDKPVLARVVHAHEHDRSVIVAVEHAMDTSEDAPRGQKRATEGDGADSRKKRRFRARASVM
jgi:hypothetical protein